MRVSSHDPMDMRTKRRTSLADACLAIPSPRLAQIDLLDRRNCDASSRCSSCGKTSDRLWTTRDKSYALRKTSSFSKDIGLLLFRASSFQLLDPAASVRR